MELHRIKVGMGQGAVAGKDAILSSVGVGSCVIVTLYDQTRRVGAMAHIMLPDSRFVKHATGVFQCTDTAIKALLELLCQRGARREHMVAKVVGGARMFSFCQAEPFGMGERNVRSAIEFLRREKISLAACDVRADYGRNVDFHLDTGRLVVNSLGREPKQL